MRCRDVITVVLDIAAPIIIRDKHLRSQLTGRDKTKRNPGKLQPERSVNQPDIPDFSDAGKKERESHHDEVTELRQTLEQQRVG